VDYEVSNIESEVSIKMKRCELWIKNMKRFGQALA